MSVPESESPIIVKRVKKGGGGGHHGGAWKIAYADFVTAMMAFFLLMWLIGSVGKSKLAGVADYFNTPLSVAMSGGASSGDRTSVMQGGGTDITHTEGQVSHAQTHSHTVTSNRSAQQQELARLADLKGNLEKSIAKNNFLSQFKDQLLIDVTDQGLRLQIVDKRGRPMFAGGSSQLEPYAMELLRRIGNVLNLVPNRMSIAGHTDAAPYPGSPTGYSNWELSADRANACRRALVAGGLSPDHILRVMGLGSAVPLDAKDPDDPMNRRISIVIFNTRAEQKVEHMTGGVLVNDQGNIAQPSAH
jgi:chemotaxis protein MotB